MFQTVIEAKSNKMYQDEEKLFNNLEWLTVKEASSYLRKSESGFRAFIFRYDVPRYYLGSSLRFRRDDLDKLIKLSPNKRRFT